MNPEIQTLASSLATDYFKRYPTNAAQQFEQLHYQDAVEILNSMSDADAALLLRLINPAFAGKLVRGLSHLAAISQIIDPTYLARIFSRLDTDTKMFCLNQLSEPIRVEIIEILEYPEGTAGSLMTSRVVSFHPSDLVETVVTRIRRIRAKNLTSIYLVDLDGKLLGRVSLQDLIGAEDEDTLHSLSNHTPSVNEMAPRDEVVEIVELNKLSSIPVVNSYGILIGAIRHDELLDIVQADALGDLQKMVGVSREEKALSTPVFSVRKRMPWLSINLLTTFAAAAVVGMFEDVIAQVTALAILLPVVAGQSGNTGAQALAVTMRGLALREIRLRHKWRVLAKEGSVGLINGLVIGCMCAIAVFVWSKSLPLALVIGVAMIVAMVSASLAGAAIPMILTALGQDPATSSSILLTTITDIVGFISFLGLATLFGHYLI